MARPKKTDAPDLSERVNLTAGAIERLACPTDKQQAFMRDSEAPGLRVRVTAAGAKSFVYEAKLNRQTIRRTIGDVKLWNIEQARRVMADTTKAIDALHAIPPNLPRDEWVKVGMGAHAAGVDFDTFDAWSAGAGNYDAAASRDVWRSIKPGKGVGAGTLYRMAAENGWRMDGNKPQQRVMQTPKKAAEPPRKPAPGMRPAEVWGRCLPATTGHPYAQAKGLAGAPLEGLGVLPDSDPAKPAPRYKLLGAEELRDLPPLAWCVRGVLPAVGLAALYGPSASGKSFLAFDMAAAIAEGRPWFDCRVTAAPVVYAALEGEAGFKLRAQAWEVSRGRALPDGLRMMLQSFKLTDPQDVIDLAAVVPAGAVVVLDTLNRAAPTADENSSRDMGEILEAAKTLQAATGGLVLLVHHTGKNAAAGLRGHSSLFAAMDAAIEVFRDGDRREWKVAKSKDGMDGEACPFKLAVEVLGFEPTGETITSCVVVRDTALEDVRAVKLPQGGNQRVILDALRELLQKAGPFATPGAPASCPPGRPAVELEVVLPRLAERLTVAPDRKTERARDGITGLVSRGVVGCDKGWIWMA